MSLGSSTLTLAQAPLLRGLSSVHLKNIESVVREKSFKKGDILFFDGKPCDQIVIVRTGRVKVFRTAVSGREQILEILNPGDTCACNPGVSQWCCSSSSQALTDCQVWIFPREKYTNMVKNNSQMAQSLNELFAHRLQKLSSLIEGVALDDPKQRIVKFILDLATSEINSPPSEKFDILPFTHEEIAQRLGLVRETITRHLQLLKRAKLIDLKPRQIIILDKDGLKKILH